MHDVRAEAGRVPELERQLKARDEQLAALEAHVAAPHMAEYRVKVKDQVKGVVLQVLKPV